MIRVNIIDDIRIIQSITKNCDENALVAWAQENEKKSGFCVFDVNGEIKEVIDNDNVFELLIRATLNYLDLRGVKEGYSSNETLFKDLKKLGFIQENSRVKVDIPTFFKPCCNCKE